MFGYSNHSFPAQLEVADSAAGQVICFSSPARKTPAWMVELASVWYILLELWRQGTNTYSSLTRWVHG